MPTPHSILGVSPNASADEIRAARRDLARRHHPDTGGDAAEMQRINAAAALALRLLEDSAAERQVAEQHHVEPEPSPREAAEWVGQTRDVPSFTVEALPVEAFEALRIVAAELGEIVDDDPPYELLTMLGSPTACWCQLDIVPDAGASTVSVSIASLDDHPLPPLVDVRNAWIQALNDLDWSQL